MKITEILPTIPTDLSNPHGIKASNEMKKHNSGNLVRTCCDCCQVTLPSADLVMAPSRIKCPLRLNACGEGVVRVGERAIG